MKGRVQSPQSKLSRKHQDKSRVKARVDLSFTGSSHELTEDADCGLIQPKSLGSYERRAIKGNTKKSDELVKYMSDVPGYLQNLPEKKALNVGVLDWSRLEKWNHSQEIVPGRVCKNTSSSNCSSSQKMSLSLSQSQRAKLSPRGTGLDRKIASETRNSSLNFPSRLEKSVRAPDGRARKKSRLPTGGIKRNNSDEVTSNLGDFSSKLRSNVTSLGTKEKISPKKSDIKMRVLDFQESGIDLGDRHCPEEPKKIVLILPRKYHQSSLSENRESKGADQSKFWSSGVQHSRVETTSEPDKSPNTHINVQNTELPSGLSEVSPSPNTIPSMLSHCKYAENNKLQGKRMDSDLIESPKVLDQGTNEGEERECRSHTPNRRFSFSLGRMSRSSSLKEGPSVPQLSSTPLITKSGPVSSEVSSLASSCSDSLNKEKRNLHNRTRSSPLRRLLDPFLKHKPGTSLHSAETVPPPKVNMNSSPSKPVASTVQAFLQLTVKNGLPLFRFVADNNNHVLAATMRNFTTPEKDDSSENFTFYSVDEIKKRSGGWMNQGSKEKKSEYVYNVVGQMKVSTHHSSSLTDLNPNQSVSRESVLFGLEPQPGDRDSTKPTLHGELAAVVVNINIPRSNDDVKKSPFSSLVTGDSASTVAILPGGLHGFPEKGVPSPLIHRWRSGGSCDCGGWDIGCKLRILSNHDQHKFSRTSITCPIQDRFELFAQEGTQQNRPIFSLAVIKNGVYSIAFSSSISLLQAFFISVAVLNSQKDYQRPVSDESGYAKTQPSFHGDVPARYVPNPPLSPVGRV